MRVRYPLPFWFLLAGPSALHLEISPAGDGRFALHAGGRRAVVHAMPGRFADQSIAWESGHTGDVVFVDAVCYRGPQRAFDFNASLPVVLGAGVELLRAEEPVATTGPHVGEAAGGVVEAVWEAVSLKIDTPEQSRPSSGP
jgi:hypothetical protein